MRIFRAIPFLFLLLDGCIDPLPLEVVATEKVLVVDGLITDQPGPYSVRLFMSKPVTSDSLTENVEGASVWIIDDDNNTFDLEETQPGVYKSGPDLRGQIGKEYRLRIVTTEGKEFLSTVEPLLGAGEIEDLGFEYRENAINQTDATLPQDVINFLVDARPDAGNSSGFSRWRSTGTYEIETYPQFRTKIVDDIVVPDPLPCSGYVNDGGVLEQRDTCVCCNCWVSVYSRAAVVPPDQFIGVGIFNDIQVLEQPVEHWRFFRKYHLEVEQLSISEHVYEFWKRVSAQQRGTGSLFQPNAVKVRGNIRCVSDPETEVYGIFSASAIVRKTLSVSRGDLPKPVAAPPRVFRDCRYMFSNTTNIKPPFW